MTSLLVIRNMGLKTVKRFSNERRCLSYYDAISASPPNKKVPDDGRCKLFCAVGWDGWVSGGKGGDGGKVVLWLGGGGGWGGGWVGGG